MSTNPTVSVVIPTYNRRTLLEPVLGPLLARPDAHEIVVVVDGCWDGSLELLQSVAATDPRVRPVWIENRGMGGARQAGVEAATGAVVLIIDDDVVLAPGAVAGHARHHAAGGHLVVVGAMPVAGGEQRDRRDYARAIYAAEYRRHCARWLEEPGSILRTLWAGHLSLRRADLLALAPAADPEIERGYHSDLDFGLRCQAAGLRGVFDPDLGGEHLYVRSPEAFLADARSSGRSFALVHAVHRSVLGALDRDRAVSGLPAPARALVRQGRSRRWPALVLAALVRGLGAIGWFRGQRFVAGLRWRIEQERAISSASGGRAQAV